MSGITPILDTLLHQVLGKRVDIPPTRELLEPVKPLTPSIATRAVQGDSQLDAGRAGVASPRLGIGEPAARQALPANPILTPASTTTHFSPAALTIADILVRFPAPPSVIQAPVPLLQSDVPNNPPLLAARLQHSIESSGLFYESHLARWYRGEMSRAALEREPQMWRFQSLQAPPAGKAGGMNSAELVGFVPVVRGRGELLNPLNYFNSLSPKASVGNHGALGMPATGRAAPAQGGAALPLPAATLASTGTASHPGQAMPTASTPEAGEITLRVPSLEAIDDTLQGIIRHQLELLVTPTLRWEGDIWSGLFMALTLQLPETLGERAGSGEEERKEGEDDPVWHSQLSLRLPRLGELDVQMHLRSASINLTLQSDSEACLATLEAGREDLEGRLRRCGLDDVRVSVLPVRNDAAWENDS